MPRFALLAVLLFVCASAGFAEASGPGGVPDVTAPAAGAPAGGPAQASPLAQFFPILMIAGLFGFMYFVVIRPQKKEEDRRKALINAIKRGDEVITIGGAHGVVEAVSEDTVDIRVGVESKGNETIVVRYNKGAVSTNVTAEKAAPKGK